MNTNKIIFAVIGAVILGLLTLLVIGLTGDKKPTQTVGGNSDISIWMMHDSASDFQSIIQKFKELYPQYSSKNISVESFESHSAYTKSLTSAFLLGQGPDIFVANNSEQSVFENQMSVISPEYVSPNDFRLGFSTVFGEDLIISDPEDPTSEYLKGVPAGFEVLGLLYNRKYYLKASELHTWSDFSRSVINVARKNSRIVPLAIGDASGVTRLSHIMRSFLLLGESEGIIDIENTAVKEVLSLYKSFAEKNGDNRYSILSAPFVENKDIDFFTEGEVAAMMGTPRDLVRIDEIGYQKSFLFASHFPQYAGGENKVALDYNYFVLNKDTGNYGLAQSFLQFLATSQGQEAFVETYSYYFSPSVDIFDSRLEKKILPNYNIVYKNFLPVNPEFVSYNVENRSMFDDAMSRILDMDSGYDTEFLKEKSHIVCSTTKYSTLLNLSSSCR